MAATGWSDAPADVLWKIIKRLLVEDYIRFGGVCVSWCAVLAQKRHPPSPQAPWILLPVATNLGTWTNSLARFFNLSEHMEYNPGTGTESPVRFFSLSDDKEYHLHIPDALRKLACIGSSHGWLLFIDLSTPESEIFMFDPIFRANATLPSIATLLETLPFGIFHLYPDPQRFLKIVVSSYGSSGFIASAIKLFTSSLVFAREGDKSWTTINTGTLDNLCDIIFYKKQLCCMTKSGWVIVVDLSHLTRPNVTLKISIPVLEAGKTLCIRYLVESDGDLLVVCRWLREETEEANLQAWRGPNDEIDGKLATVSINVLKLDMARNRWIELESLGDHALFLGSNPSLSVSCREFSEPRRNCVYLTNMFRIGDSGSDLLMYHMEDRSLEPLLTLCKSKLKRPRMFWFIPNLSSQVRKGLL